MTIEKIGNLLVAEKNISAETGLSYHLEVLLGEEHKKSIELFLLNNSRQDLMHITLDTLKSYGFPENVAEKLLAIIKFTTNMIKLDSKNQNVTVKTPRDAATFLMYLQNETQKHFVVLFLDAKCQVIAKKTIFIGTVSEIAVHPREIMKEAFKLSASSFICANNHVSGNPSPTPNEIRLTEDLIRIGEIMKVELADHIIIGQGSYVSLKEKGYV